MGEADPRARSSSPPLLEALYVEDEALGGVLRDVDLEPELMGFASAFAGDEEERGEGPSGGAREWPGMPLTEGAHCLYCSGKSYRVKEWSC